jgi:hypothetical protein
VRDRRRAVRSVVEAQMLYLWQPVEKPVDGVDDHERLPAR